MSNGDSKNGYESNGEKASTLSHDSREYLFVDNVDNVSINNKTIKNNLNNDQCEVEPKLDRTDSSERISQLIAEAQMDDYVTDYAESSHNERKNSSDVLYPVLYLGSATISDPLSTNEILKTMTLLLKSNSATAKIMLCIRPDEFCWFDENNETLIERYNIDSICKWGKDKQNFCFATNIAYGIDDPSFRCHVFQCEDQNEVEKLNEALETVKNSEMVDSQIKDVESYLFKFIITLDLWEEDGKGSYQQVARDKNYFKLRKELQRKVVFEIEQPSFPKIKIQRCFGLLLAQGRDVAEQELHLLPELKTDHRPGDRVIISGHWNPMLDQWKMLNTDTGKDNRIYMTVAADIVLENLQEPIRILKEVKVRVFNTNEKFWNPSKPKIQDEYQLQVFEKLNENGVRCFVKKSFLSSQEKEKAQHFSFRSVSSLWKNTNVPHQVTQNDKENSNDIEFADHNDEVFEVEGDQDDEPLLSGTGNLHEEFSLEHIATCENILKEWEETNIKPNVSFLMNLLQTGFPDFLRAKLWELIIGLENNSDLLKSYEYLIEKESPQEQVIIWDFKRTFPSHEFFKEAGGKGQMALYNVSKAYSIYDEEVGYCQGLSFLIAVLLLHVEEEIAYCMLVKIMYVYGHRNLFKDGFALLHESFYVLKRLLEQYIPDLFEHFQSTNTEIHMFASQWFLTLFTVKFPLPLVFQIIDLVLCQGCDVSFQFALAFLKHSKRELLALNFEGIMKYFRVGLPKKYINEENIKELIDVAFSFKISKKQLMSLKEEFMKMKKEEAEKEDPITYLKRENHRITTEYLRLERENDILALEIVTTQVSTQETILDREEKINNLTKESEKLKCLLAEYEEEINRLKMEEICVKEMWRDSTFRSDTEKEKREKIIHDYKQILSQSESRFEQEKKELQSELLQIKKQLSNCEKCSQNILHHPSPGSSPTVSPVIFPKDDNDQQLKDLETELIITKLALAEERNRADEIEMKLHGLAVASERPWYKKVVINNKR
ncbi:rab GTPase-activating protein 1 isoform X1 [Hydra vulgaris]|nr:rab GTPase-activating protein 1 isoform X1 [Hydra vulgaris]